MTRFFEVLVIELLLEFVPPRHPTLGVEGRDLQCVTDSINLSNDLHWRRFFPKECYFLSQRYQFIGLRIEAELANLSS